MNSNIEETSKIISLTELPFCINVIRFIDSVYIVIFSHHMLVDGVSWRLIEDCMNRGVDSKEIRTSHLNILNQYVTRSKLESDYDYGTAYWEDKARTLHDINKTSQIVVPLTWRL